MLTMAGLAKLAYTQCLKIIEDESLIAFCHANGLTFALLQRPCKMAVLSPVGDVCSKYTDTHFINLRLQCTPV